MTEPLSIPVLSVDRVVKHFGKTIAVDGISLDIRENEFFALLGPSGCGKTTLLRMIAGFEVPDSGSIHLGDRDITREAPDKRPLNLMFQSYALFPHMTVWQNLAYGLEMERLPRGEIASRVDDMLKTTDLVALSARKPAELSGGQKQRVALARALIKRPKVLLLDEPLGALDKKLREKMQLELKRLQHEVGITFIIVTHDQEEALVMADRIAVLRDGHILQCGTPQDIYERPANRFVAGFIGMMNFIEGEIGSDALFRAAGQALVCDMHGLKRSAPAVLAVRPEHILLRPEGSGVAGTVVDVAYHGLDRQLYVKTALSQAPLQVRVAAAGPEEAAARTGASVSLGFDAAACRLFQE
ncbi:ABC transporter ATP-binding protein [Pararhizobium antarcticum]|uniref:Spermidine/putrescine import ATP-binding protein PotA n=1 Tax=Pararhizobium antarcticum TaxID=1798805 RepID=A0A657LMS1_9HYPH|nr:ABC transporter ATP-binding protein [Pararhizobium antarcticum]OJF90703.1 spermidine/putrescine ABC transporter ATP-binding protein [Rhizobium sp. 58]OJF91394.1 spermidine/putrescine ABC transporter ATP-binding protein [Pararhizobium antarcticum]